MSASANPRCDQILEQAPATWSEERARCLAERHGLGQLSAQQWQLIRYLREHRLQYGAPPPVALLCSLQHLSRDQLRGLFGSEQEVYTLAGVTTTDSANEAGPYAI